MAFSFSTNGITAGSVASNVATFSSVPTGTTASDRIVYVNARIVSSNAQVAPSVTIDGIAATIYQFSNITGTQYFVAAYAVVPTGTTANVVMTFGANILGTVYCISWSLFGADNAPADFDQSTGSGTGSKTTTVTIPTGGAQLCGVTYTLITITSTWATSTERFDVQGGSGSASAADFSPGTGAAHGASVTPSASANNTLTSTAWGPPTIASADGAVTGTSTVAGIGNAIKPAAGAIAGVGAVAAVGRAQKNAVGALAGVGAVVGVGRALAEAVGTISATGTVSGVGLPLSVGVGAISATSVIQGISTDSAGIGAIAATGTVTGVGRSLVQAVGTISAAGIVAGGGGEIRQGVGNISATGVVAGVGRNFWSSVGTIAGVSVVDGGGSKIVNAVGTISAFSQILAYYGVDLFHPYPMDSTKIYQGTMVQPVLRAVSMAHFWSFVTIPAANAFPISPLPQPRVVTLADDDWMWIYQGEDELPRKVTLQQLRAYYYNLPIPFGRAVYGWVTYIENSDKVDYVEGTGGNPVRIDVKQFLHKP